MMNSVLTYPRSGLKRWSGSGMFKQAVILKREGDAHLLNVSATTNKKLSGSGMKERHKRFAYDFLRGTG